MCKTWEWAGGGTVTQAVVARVTLATSLSTSLQLLPIANIRICEALQTSKQLVCAHPSSLRLNHWKTSMLFSRNATDSSQLCLYCSVCFNWLQARARCSGMAIRRHWRHSQDVHAEECESELKVCALSKKPARCCSPESNTYIYCHPGRPIQSEVDLTGTCQEQIHIYIVILAIYTIWCKWCWGSKPTRELLALANDHMYLFPVVYDSPDH